MSPRDRLSELPLAARLQASTEIEARRPRIPQWSLDNLRGRLIEMSGMGDQSTATFAASLIARHQFSGSLCAWIHLRGREPFVPDLVQWTIDLSALAFIEIEDVPAANRVAYHLLCSAAFSLLILDLGARATMPTPVQGRLAKLAQRHGCTVACLTEKEETHASLGSMISLRAQTRYESGEPGRIRCHLRVIKDKRAGPGWQHEEIVRAPPGLMRA